MEVFLPSGGIQCWSWSWWMDIQKVTGLSGHQLLRNSPGSI